MVLRPTRADTEPLEERSAWVPPVDIYELGDTYRLSAELPGVDARDVRIEVAGSDVSIRGERRFDTDSADESYHCLEGFRGRFCRTFSLPEPLDHKTVRAELKEGVLEVVLPKKLERGRK